MFLLQLTETCLAAAWMIETPNVTAKYDPEVHARKLAIETDVEMAAGTGCIEAFSGTAGIAGIRRVLDLIETPSNMVGGGENDVCWGSATDLPFFLFLAYHRATLRMSSFRFSPSMSIKTFWQAKEWGKSCPCRANPMPRFSSCHLVSSRTSLAEIHENPVY